MVFSSLGRDDPFILVLQDWMIGRILDCGSLSMRWDSEMSVHIRASAKKAQVALSCPRLR